MKFIKSMISILLVIVLSSSIFCMNSEASGLSKKQRATADYIAKVTMDNWNKYHVLPSVAVAQAFVESSLGKCSKGYNLWGIGSGKYSYSSLYTGCIAYLKVINNGYYKGAPGQTNYKIQLRKILDGGYCQPEGAYYSNAMYGYNHYNFYKYDKKMFKKWKAEKKKKAKKQRIKLQKKTYTVKYSSKVPSNKLGISKKVVLRGTIVMRTKMGDMVGGIYEVYHMKYKKGIIYTSDKSLVGKKVKLEVSENAKG